MKQENKDIGDEKLIRDDNGVQAFNEEEKKKSMETTLLIKSYWMSNSPGEKRICQLLIQYLDLLFLSLRRWW